MTKEEFKTLFEHALEIAAQNAEKKLGCPVPRQYEVELHGREPTPRTMPKEDALDEVYLGPDRFYRIINVSVRRVSKDLCTVFMGISGHPPGSLNQTWNQPLGSGPFKQVLADEVKVI